MRKAAYTRQRSHGWIVGSYGRWFPRRRWPRRLSLPRSGSNRNSSHTVGINKQLPLPFAQQQFSATNSAVVAWVLLFRRDAQAAPHASDAESSMEPV